MMPSVPISASSLSELVLNATQGAEDMALASEVHCRRLWLLLGRMENRLRYRNELIKLWRECQDDEDFIASKIDEIEAAIDSEIGLYDEVAEASAEISNDITMVVKNMTTGIKILSRCLDIINRYNMIQFLQEAEEDENGLGNG